MRDCKLCGRKWNPKGKMRMVLQLAVVECTFHVSHDIFIIVKTMLRRTYDRANYLYAAIRKRRPVFTHGLAASCV